MNSYKKYSSKKILILCILGIGVLVLCLPILNGIKLKFDRWGESESNAYEKRVEIPEIVHVRLFQSREDNLRVVLHITGEEISPCDDGNLATDTEINGDVLVVDIGGYTTFIGRDPFSPCPDAIVIAKAQVDISDFLKSGGKELVLNLNSKVNTFNVIRDGQAVYLDPVSLSNVTI